MEATIKCPRCGANMVKCISYAGDESEFWVKCERAPKCNTYFNTFKPLPHQYDVMRDGHRWLGNFGGFG